MIQNVRRHAQTEVWGGVITFESRSCNNFLTAFPDHLKGVSHGAAVFEFAENFGIRDHTSQGTTLWTPNNKLQSTMFKQQTQILCLLTTLLLKWYLMMKILMTAPSVVLQLKHLFVFPVVPWPQLEVEFGAATWAYKSKPKVKSHLKRRCVHWAVQEGKKW